MFAWLAVFAGGSTLEAAEAVCDADLDTLQSLVDKSLLRRAADRFWMLETIREYALERFHELARRSDVEQRHSDFFLSLARAAEIGERGPDQVRWWNRLDEELDNIREAIERAGVRGSHAEQLELAALLKNFWHVRGHLPEGKRHIERALHLAHDVDHAIRTPALAALAAGGKPITPQRASRPAAQTWQPWQ